MKTGIVKGRDTITSPSYKVPESTVIPFEVMKNLHIAKQGINKQHIAILPYCVVCKVALSWNFNSPGFWCPKCRRVWTYSVPDSERVVR